MRRRRPSILGPKPGETPRVLEAATISLMKRLEIGQDTEGSTD